MRRHQGVKVEHFDVSNVIYHKFSHGAASYMLNGEIVNVMLELSIIVPKHSLLSGPSIIFSGHQIYSERHI